MDNVNEELSGGYVNALNGEHIPEDAYFCAGVFLSMLLPEFTLVAYGGLLPLAAFALTAVAGTVYGVVKYRSAFRPLSCVVLGAEERVPQLGDGSLNWAAC